jgi:drug/metabolite transporter (DMT)-like permease
MSSTATLLLAVFLVGTAVGQLLFKAASIRAASSGHASVWVSMALEPFIWLGVGIYICEFFVWLAFVSLVPLWQAVMVANLDILVVMICGRLFFGESITHPRLFAVTLITIGVILVGWGA